MWKIPEKALCFLRRILLASNITPAFAKSQWFEEILPALCCLRVVCWVTTAAAFSAEAGG
jgi:uncharacterized membrane protein YjdF